YVDNEWKPVNSEVVSYIKEKWNQTKSVVPPVGKFDFFIYKIVLFDHLSAQLQRFIDGRWICPKDETFLEFVDNQWVEISPGQVEDIREQYDAADPFKKIVDGVKLLW